jgi:hypothetical protein
MHMTASNRNKTLARLIQDATDDSYAACLQRVRDHEAQLRVTWGDTVSSDLGERLRWWALDAVIEGHVRAALPAGSPITVSRVTQNMGHCGIELHDPESGWWLDLALVDDFPGYIWRRPNDLTWIAMANFTYDATGAELTGETVLTGDTVAAAVLRDAVTWIVRQFAAHPDRYDDAGRPASVAEPVFD